MTARFPGAPDILAQWNARHEITIWRDARFDRAEVMHEIVHELLDGDDAQGDQAWEECRELGMVVGVEG